MVDGLVFNVQDLSLQDGPGIRTTVFFKGCPLRCRWCCNPEGQEPVPELMHFRSLCRACGSCLEACPHRAGAFAAGFPQFDRGRCRSCRGRECSRACPARALRVSGERASRDQLVRRFRANIPYFRNSGGGVTLSGGEPLAQPAFARELLLACKLEAISIGVETCGFFDWEAAAGFIGDFDFYYFDVKCLDARRHKRETGAANAMILENLRRLSALAAARTTVTLTLVPGVNDGEDFARGAAALCRELGIRGVRLLAYHEMGSGKYAALGRRCPQRKKKSLAPGVIEARRDFFLSGGSECTIE